MPSDLDRVRKAAREDKDARFTALLHHVTESRLRWAYGQISPKATPGVDGVTWRAYGEDLDANIADLHRRLQSGSYRAKPSRRAYIPKADGRQRPLGIASLEDKIAQRAVVEVARGDMIIVRFADDFTAGFEHREDAERFLAGLRERFTRFGLELHPDKTRLIEFGRRAAWRAASGGKRPETFTFLGFTHMCEVSKSGRFWVRRRTSAKKKAAKLKALNVEMKRRRHQPIPDQGRWLASVLRGHMNYYAVPGNTQAVNAFRSEITRLWVQGARAPKPEIPDEALRRPLAAPAPRHAPFPDARLAAKYPR